MGMRAAFSAARLLDFMSFRSTRVWFSTTSPADLADSDGDSKQMPPNPTLDTNKLRAISRVSEIGPTGKLPPPTRYLIEIGLELDKIKLMTKTFPNFAYCTLERIRPTVEFLLDLGVLKSDIPLILYRSPQLCMLKSITPRMTFLEEMGVDKTKWAKVIRLSPALLTRNRQKIQTTVDFLIEMGVSKQNIGKILTRCPQIIACSVEDKLRPNADYFRSLSVDVAVVLYRSPNTFCLSIESNLKPITEFFLDKGFSIEEIGAMVSRFGPLYSLSLVQNLIPKWEFFLTMDYPKSELVKFPPYFGYSLEERIKPRYALVKENGVKMGMTTLLLRSQSIFDKVLKSKIAKTRSKEAIPGQSNEVFI